jgi:hypothetical protein
MILLDVARNFTQLQANGEQQKPLSSLPGWFSCVIVILLFSAASGIFHTHKPAPSASTLKHVPAMIAPVRELIHPH